MRTQAQVPRRLPTQIYVNNADQLLASCGPVFMVEWRDKTLMDGCEALLKECTTYAESQPNGLGLLTIIHATAPLPEKEERKHIAKFLQQSGGFIKHSTVVVEGEGFRSACVRSVVTGLAQLARQPFPHKVYSLSAGMNALARTLGYGTEASSVAMQLERDIEHLRQKAALDLRRRSAA